MKIANVVCVFHPYKSGISNAAYDIAMMSEEIGNDNTVFTPLYRREEKMIDNYNGLSVIRLKPLFKYGNGAFIPNLLFLLKKMDCTYLHYPFFGGAEIVWLYFLLFSKKSKLIIHYHMDVKNISFIAKFFSLPSILIRNNLFKRADAIICSSLDYIKSGDMKDVYKLMPQKFYEIPFTVDTEKFYPCKEINYSSKKKIVFIGGLDKAHNFKGVDILINALSKIEKTDLELLVIGSGDLMSEYVNLAKKRGILEKVKFLSDVTDSEIADILRTSNALILPSTAANEAFGIVLLEAMASGIPVIASALPGVRTVFTDGVHGFLVKPGDEYDLKEKIEIIISNDTAAQEMGKQGRSLVERKYSREQLKNNLKNIYSNITN